MKTTQSVDFLIWKYFMPAVNPEAFKSKLFSLLAIFYIAYYKWPRKFMWHYFTGKGKTLPVATKNIITSNSAVYDMLISEINNAIREDKTNGIFFAGQIHVNNPNYKYSIGSLYIAYSLKDKFVSLQAKSDYRFTQNNSRITKHLHNWLHSLKEKGYAHDFNIEGNRWEIAHSDLLTAKVDRRFKEYDLLNMLYV